MFQALLSIILIDTQGIQQAEYSMLSWKKTMLAMRSYATIMLICMMNFLTNWNWAADVDLYDGQNFRIVWVESYFDVNVSHKMGFWSSKMSDTKLEPNSKIDKTNTSEL